MSFSPVSPECSGADTHITMFLQCPALSGSWLLPSLPVPDGVKIHAGVHREGKEEQHKSQCWIQAAIFILPSFASALLRSSSTNRQAAFGC